MLQQMLSDYLIIIQLGRRRATCSTLLGFHTCYFMLEVHLAHFINYSFIYHRRPMESQAKINQHRQKMNQMRSALKVAPIIKKATLPMEAKIEKGRMRRKSATLDPFLDKDFADSQSENESEQETKSLFGDMYVLGEKIGEGAHGVVKKCYSKTTNELFAVKICTLDPEHILFLRQNFIDIKKLKHPHIISYKAIFFELNHQKYHLVMDYLPYPDLLHIAIKTQQQLKELIYQVVETLAYIHSHKICHRDIKPENIMYDSDRKKVILVDFGISKKLIKRGIKRDMLTLTGTPYYRAPEMFQGGGYDQLVDMWALGITIYKLMAGVTPFESQYHSDTILNIVKGQFVFPPKVEARYSRQARIFVSRLLRPKIERMTAKEALNDLWFIDIDRQNEDFIRSVTINAKNNKGHLKQFEISVNGPVLQRNNTYRESSENEGKSRQQIMKRLKSLQGVEQQESMIYGYGEDESPRKNFKPFN